MQVKQGCAGHEKPGKSWNLLFQLPGLDTGSRGVLFDHIFSYIHRTIVAQIDLLLIQIAVHDRTVNMRLCYATIEILSSQRILQYSILWAITSGD